MQFPIWSFLHKNSFIQENEITALKAKSEFSLESLLGSALNLEGNLAITTFSIIEFYNTEYCAYYMEDSVFCLPT